MPKKPGDIKISREQQNAVQQEIDGIDADIVDLMIQIEQAKADIEATQGQIETKQSEIEQTSADISAKEAEIEATKADIAVTEQNLQEANDRKDKQYADMKKRIQFIYENGGDIGWATLILNEGDVTSFFNKAEYTQQLHEYDREKLEEYINTIHEIEVCDIFEDWTTCVKETDQKSNFFCSQLCDVASICDTYQVVRGREIEAWKAKRQAEEDAIYGYG